MKKTKKFSPELRERAVRMGQEQGREYPSLWASIGSLAPKIGWVPQILIEWVKRAEVDAGAREGVTTVEALRRPPWHKPTTNARQQLRERAQSALPQQPLCSGGEEFKDGGTNCSHCSEVVKQPRILLVAARDRPHRSVIQVSVASMGVAQRCGCLL